MNGPPKTGDAKARKRQLLEELRKVQQQKADLERQIEVEKANPRPAPSPPPAAPAAQKTAGQKRPAEMLPETPQQKLARIERERQSRADKQIWGKCREIVRGILKNHEYKSVFGAPVTEAVAPGYSMLIKRPMDLGTITSKLDKRLYNTPYEFREDMRLVWSNCFIYNREGTKVRKLGQTAQERWERRWQESLVETLWQDEQAYQKLEEEVGSSG